MQAISKKANQFHILSGSINYFTDNVKQYYGFFPYLCNEKRTNIILQYEEKIYDAPQYEVIELELQGMIAASGEFTVPDIPGENY